VLLASAWCSTDCSSDSYQIIERKCTTSATHEIALCDQQCVLVICMLGVAAAGVPYCAVDIGAQQR
jgi:hypothetical protein